MRHNTETCRGGQRTKYFPLLSVNDRQWKKKHSTPFVRTLTLKPLASKTVHSIDDPVVFFSRIRTVRYILTRLQSVNEAFTRQIVCQHGLKRWKDGRRMDGREGGGRGRGGGEGRSDDII